VRDLLSRVGLRRRFGLIRMAAAVGRRAFVRHALRRVLHDLGIQRRGRFRLAPLARHLGVLVFVIGVAGRAARLLDVLADHRDDRVVGHASLARTVIVQNVTKPKLALLHQRSRNYRWQGMNCERWPYLSRACPSPSSHCRNSPSRASTAPGAVDWGVRFAPTDTAGVTRAATSGPNWSLAARHSSADSDSNSRCSATSLRTSAPTISCARRNGTPRPTR